MNNGEMIFQSGNVAFQISNEAASGINTGNVKIYDETLKRLLDAVKDVKRQKYFGDIDVSNLAKKYPFKPFQYQIENVNTMLNRFEGRGVFGDQVGLGKTVEALMTAHAMFESGAIRNAVLIVNATTKDDWRNEIKNKFPDIFEIHDVTERSEERDDLRLFAALDEMERNKNDRNRDKKDIYILTDKIFSDDHLQDIYNFEEYYSFATYYFDSLDAASEAELKQLEEELMRIGIYKSVGTIGKIFLEYGYSPSNYDDDGYSSDDTFQDRGLLFNVPQEGKFTRAIEILKALKGSLPKEDEIDPWLTTKREGLVKVIDNYIDSLTEDNYKYIDRYRGFIEYNLANVLSDTYPTIDLMIIDEIHSFYVSDANNTASFENIFMEQGKDIDIIAEFKKKFCVLLSATPIRTELDNVLDLLYIVDSKRFGVNIEEATDYFYSTICRIPKDTEYPLNKIFDFNDATKRNSFFGIINNFFTRKRIGDVSSHMTGRYEGELPSYSAIKDLIDEGKIEAFKERLKKKFIMIFMQSGMWTSKQAESAWKNNVDINWSNGANIKSDRREKECLKAAIDAVIMAELKDPDLITDIAKLNKAYYAVNWNRRGKRGIAFIGRDKPSSPADKMGDLVSALSQADQYILHDSNVNVEQAISNNGFVITSFEDQFKSRAEVEDKCKFWHEELATPFMSALCSNAILCYLSKSGDRENIAGNIQKYKYPNDDKSKSRNVVYDEKALIERVTDENYNQIAIVNEDHMAGINYQDYSTFIFAHMDIKGERLLEPVDIEQWIGRIHRTGQVKECRIVTVLATTMENGPEPDFLQWYYEILADPKGLDLYGNNTPDIALLQPIIVDKLRASLSSRMASHTNDAKKLKDMKLINDINRDIKDYSFSELMEAFYWLKGQEYVKTMIRDLCAIEGFGKKNDN